MNPYDRLPDAAAELFGEEATAEEAYGLLTVDVPVGSWVGALETARDQLGCTYFDWLSAVDEPGTGFRVCAHVVALGEGRVRRLLIRTTLPHEAAALPTATGVYAGAAWHERETYEMFGIDFPGHPHLVPLLLPEGFEGHPLRKDFVLAARVAKAWPGAKEPGESEHGGPKRRTMLPPGVPDPNDWGPLKGQLPPAPARPARAARAAGGAPGERPARRARSVSEGSASQAAPAAEPPKPTPDAPWQQPAARPEAGAAPTTPASPADGEAPAQAASRTAPAEPAGARPEAKAAPQSLAVPAGGAAPAQAAPRTVPADPTGARPEAEAGQAGQPAAADGEHPPPGGPADDNASAPAGARKNTPEKPATGEGGESA